MPRIAGVDIPENKPTWIALTYLYGIGRKNVLKILNQAKIDGAKKASDLSSEEIAKISKVLEDFKIEGDLRREVSENIKRLKEIGSYRGIRHAKNLPVRGQRTRTNARTKRGKRVTIGAMKKEVLTTRIEPGQKVKGEKKAV
ncbi:MAG: 30S ribosomal protein S13 [Patescibacteria group bacterium]